MFGTFFTTNMISYLIMNVKHNIINGWQTKPTAESVEISTAICGDAEGERATEMVQTKRGTEVGWGRERTQGKML